MKMIVKINIIVARNIKFPTAPAIEAREPKTVCVNSTNLEAKSSFEDCPVFKKFGSEDVNFSTKFANSIVNVSLSTRLEKSMACFEIWEIKLPKKPPMEPNRRITTSNTETPLLFIFLSKLSTLDKRIVVKRNAKTNIKITFDMYGQMVDKNQTNIKPIMIR